MGLDIRKVASTFLEAMGYEPDVLEHGEFKDDSFVINGSYADASGFENYSLEIYREGDGYVVKGSVCWGSDNIIVGDKVQLDIGSVEKIVPNQVGYEFSFVIRSEEDLKTAARVLSEMI